MIHGIGTDIVEIKRIRKSLERFGERFARRLLTAAELAEWRQSRQPARFLAKRFAAKEAVAKALGLGIRAGLAFEQIGVTHDAFGKPGVVYSGAALEHVLHLGIADSLISIADERDYAVAFAVLTRAPGSHDFKSFSKVSRR